MTRVTERPSSGNRLPSKKPAALKCKLQTAEARIEVLDDIDALKEMNAQLSESLPKSTSNEPQIGESLWADVDGNKEDHHLGAGLNGRWF